ncbi:hypothetical protein Tco_1483648 [Tanacetum coccineum]
MVQTRNSDNNNPPDPIATQLAAIAAKLEAIETMKEDIAALKEGERLPEAEKGWPKVIGRVAGGDGGDKWGRRSWLPGMVGDIVEEGGGWGRRQEGRKSGVYFEKFYKILQKKRGKKCFLPLISSKEQILFNTNLCGLADKKS